MKEVAKRKRTLDSIGQVTRKPMTARKDGLFDPWCNGSTADFGSAGPGSNPGGSTTQHQQTMDAYKNKRGEQLKPLNVGPHTWLLVSPDKATKERANKFKRDCERSQRMAKNIR